MHLISSSRKFNNSNRKRNHKRIDQSWEWHGFFGFFCFFFFFCSVVAISSLYMNPNPFYLKSVWNRKFKCLLLHVSHTHIRSHTGTQTSILCAHGIYVYILNIKNPMESAHTKLKIACKSNFIPKWNCRYVYIWTKCVIIVYGVNLNMPTGAHCKEKDFFFFFSFCFVFSVVVHINAYFSNNNSDSQSSNCVCCVL